MEQMKRFLRYATSVTAIGYGLVAAVIVLVIINFASRP
jgi:Flp pilus assembly pilin Flp